MVSFLMEGGLFVLWFVIILSFRRGFIKAPWRVREGSAWDFTI